MDTREHRENILEAVLMAGEIGDVTAASIRQARPDDVHTDVSSGDIDVLVEEGFLLFDGDRIHLSESGKEIAVRTVRRHRLAEMLLFSLLGIDRDLASQIACTVEHGIREEMLEGVCTLLGHPDACPHGRPIPPGPCCKAGKVMVETQVVALTSLKPGERGRVVYVEPQDHHRLHHLSALGLNPGVVVELHQRQPAFCIRFEETEIAIDQNVAADIQVSRLK